VAAKKPEALPHWSPPAFDPADAYALKALQTGTANESQQKRALDWIIHRAAWTYNDTYSPFSERDSTFAQGRRFVGLQIVKLLNLSAAVLDSLKKD
jgi:hypothetical protein